ncbi:hypothetical protein CBW65_02780 [Tumebacillus avium]|uniref:Uncharacterized protein n=1 Tax=Tumebacillus avium TaxID=1903704 RepID=A0A1Y0IIH3_9BACL|nr:hypothetical protein [Tumebacillus avium]ARU60100.1 hypothetical protein CBW65_02780 [Tumebacillus avium]
MIEQHAQAGRDSVGECTNQPAIKHNKKAMFLCVEDELHDIGQRIVGCLFEELGWDVGGRLVSKFDLAPYCGEQTVLLGDLPHIHTWLTEQHLAEHSGVSSRGR